MIINIFCIIVLLYRITMFYRNYNDNHGFFICNLSYLFLQLLISVFVIIYSFCTVPI